MKHEDHHVTSSSSAPGFIVVVSERNDHSIFKTRLARQLFRGLPHVRFDLPQESGREKLKRDGLQEFGEGVWRVGPMWKLGGSRMHDSMFWRIGAYQVGVGWWEENVHEA